MMHHYIEHDRHHLEKKTDVKEIVKVAQIRDIYGNLRYEVILRSFNRILDEKQWLLYEVQVVNFFGVEKPVVIAQQPEQCEIPMTDYCLTVKFYNEYLERYKHLVEAEVKDIQDISIYKDKIGYKIVCPECCATCKWCKYFAFDRCERGQTQYKLECVNPHNMSDYGFDVSPTRHHCKDKLIIHPNVEPFGWCRRYLCGSKVVPVEPYGVEDIDYN